MELPPDHVHRLAARPACAAPRATAKGIGGESAFEGKAAPSNIKDDGDATEGFTDDEDMLFGEAGKKLELEDLANGYPDDNKGSK